MIDKKIDEENGPKLLEYILVAFSVKPDSQKIVEQVIYNLKDSIFYLNRCPYYVLLIIYKIKLLYK